MAVIVSCWADVLFDAMAIMPRWCISHLRSEVLMSPMLASEESSRHLLAEAEVNQLHVIDLGSFRFNFTSKAILEAVEKL